MNDTLINNLAVLKTRFQQHMHRHPTLDFDETVSRLTPDQCRTLNMMALQGGEPDFVEMGEHIYLVEMFKESPSQRCRVCYDLDARVGRKRAAPLTSAVEMAKAMGSHLVDETLYFALQQIEVLDERTSVWLLTPASVRQHGGAIFGDYRFGRVFIYHNGADSYYSNRGFRTYLKLS